jgi:hypothetical protein
MEKQYKLSTNWLPWLGFGFLLSTIFFGFVSNGWLLFVLILLSFMPAIVVALALKGYVVLDNNQIKICYDRKNGRETTSALTVADITSIERVGKSIVFHLDNEEDVTMRVSWANLLVEEIIEQNPRIEYKKSKK